MPGNTEGRQVKRLTARILENHELLIVGDEPNKHNMRTEGDAIQLGDIVQKQIDFWKEMRSKHQAGVEAATTRMRLAHWGGDITIAYPFWDSYESKLDSVLNNKATWLPKFQLENNSKGTAKGKKAAKKTAGDTEEANLALAMGQVYSLYNDMGQAQFDQVLEQFCLDNNVAITMTFQNKAGPTQKRKQSSSAQVLDKGKKRKAKQSKSSRFETPEHSEDGNERVPNATEEDNGGTASTTVKQEPRSPKPLAFAGFDPEDLNLAGDGDEEP